MDSNVENKTAFTYLTIENVDYWGADIWSKGKPCESWDEFTQTAKSTLKPGQVMMWDSKKKLLYLKTFIGATPKESEGCHVIIYAKSL